MSSGSGNRLGKDAVSSSYGYFEVVIIVAVVVAVTVSVITLKIVGKTNVIVCGATLTVALHDVASDLEMRPTTAIKDTVENILDHNPE